MNVAIPRSGDSVKVPPIKCQGIKTKLVPFLLGTIQWSPMPSARWVEPFLGSGVVAFNLAPQRALLADSNQHIIRFYQAVQAGEIDGQRVRSYLTAAGQTLSEVGESYYYEVRDRFNAIGSSLDFLFLSRACFNGLMRFNSKGQFNVPFCRKPQRFSRSYVTKIVNQVDWVARQMVGKDWEFRVADWREVLQEAQPCDFVYLDPPYMGRHTDYYNAWGQCEADQLAIVTRSLPCGFAVSMWLENQYRQNHQIQQHWSGLEQRVYQHFYHIGSKETWRGGMVEALLVKPGFAALPELD